MDLTTAIYVSCLLIMMLYIVLSIKEFVGPKSNVISKTNPSLTDSLNITIDRIDYANNVNGLVNYRAWTLLQAISVSFFISYFVYDGFPGFRMFFSMVFINFVMLYGFSSFYKHHVANSLHYYTNENINALRTSLKTQRDLRSIPINNTPNMKSFYYEYIIDR